MRTRLLVAVAKNIVFAPKSPPLPVPPPEEKGLPPGFTTPPPASLLLVTTWVSETLSRGADCGDIGWSLSERLRSARAQLPS